ncbi:MAG: PilZ domain-containing protein [Magnetococcales bacterium]|nr:PilZ domain-containing protein [Magnetococcales bacterium]
MPPFRINDRFALRTKIRLEIALGQTIAGYTTDVSISGAFLQTDQSTEECQIDDKGNVFIETKEGDETYDVSFPCVVARITPQGIGLDFDYQLMSEADQMALTTLNPTSS